MNTQIAAEVKKFLGIPLEITSYTEIKAFPYMLTSLYEFYLGKANGTSFLVMNWKAGAVYTPGQVERHLAQIREITGLPAVFAAEQMAAYKRQRFLEKQIPFIVPGKQMYIPFLGLLLTEQGPRIEKSYDGLGNLAQILLLARLQRKYTEPLSIADVITHFHYSRISVIRAFDELEYFQLGRRNPKTKHLEFPDAGKTLWQRALPLLKNPRKKSMGMEQIPNGLQAYPAGINALANRSMLAAGPQQEFAVEAKQWNKRKLTAQCPKEDAPILVELWMYPPNIIGEDCIDPLSLYLTLQNDPDERVQIALEEMLKGVL